MEKRFEPRFEHCIEDNKTHNTFYSDRVTVCKILNEQDEKIKELEEKLRYFMSIKNKEQLSKENEALKDTIAVVLAQKGECLKNNAKLREENQQLKQSQNSKAIEALGQLLDKYDFYQNSDAFTLVEPKADDTTIPLYTYILSQITELRGGEK